MANPGNVGNFLLLQEAPENLPPGAQREPGTNSCALAQSRVCIYGKVLYNGLKETLLYLSKS